MELFAILLSGLISVVSPVGFVVDQLAEDAIRDQFESVESLDVRVDNAPSFQLLQGKVEHVRIAGRGVVPVPDLRVAAIDIETDPLDFNTKSLQQGKPALDEPLQAGIRVVLEQSDLNQFLQSPTIADQLKFVGGTFLPNPQTVRVERYLVLDPRVEFLDNQRLRFQITLEDRLDAAQLPILVEAGLALNAEGGIQLVDPVVQAGGADVPDRVLNELTAGINRRLSPTALEPLGVTARPLKLEITPDALELALFVKVDPDTPLLNR